MVYLSKPAHWGDPAFTYKTGGCNNEASVVERISDLSAERKRKSLESNRWC